MPGLYWGAFEPGAEMALTTLAAYKTAAGITSTNATRDAALTVIIAAVSQAVKDRVKQRLEPETYTRVLTPPASDRLVLKELPVRSITSIYLNSAAYGDPAAFTSDHLLTAYTDYWLEVSEDGYSRSGVVRRTNSLAWGTAGLVAGGGAWAWSPAMTPLLAGGGGLTRSVGPAAGSLKITYVAGYTSVPEPITQAVHLAVSRLYGIRKTGVGLGSESWNGYSVGYAAVTPEAVAGVLSSPEIAGLLRPYIDLAPSFGGLGA